MASHNFLIENKYRTFPVTIICVAKKKKELTYEKHFWNWKSGYKFRFKRITPRNHMNFKISSCYLHVHLTFCFSLPPTPYFENGVSDFLTSILTQFIIIPSLSLKSSWGNILNKMIKEWEIHNKLFHVLFTPLPKTSKIIFPLFFILLLFCFCPWPFLAFLNQNERKYTRDLTTTTPMSIQPPFLYLFLLLLPMLLLASVFQALSSAFHIYVSWNHHDKLIWRFI